MEAQFDFSNVNVCVLGLGYVGLPLAAAFAKRGTRATGFDVNTAKVDRIAKAEEGTDAVAEDTLRELLASGMLRVTATESDLDGCNVFIICVPTPLDRYRKPDLSYIEAASRVAGRHLRPGSLVCLESTSYPTTTEDLVLPILEAQSGLKTGSDFWLCFSPERVDPGNREYGTENTPKIVGGLGPRATEIAVAVYRRAVQRVLPVSSPRTAEMVKILENTYRLVNISLVNELALLASRLGIDIWEVIEAAKTKPFGFQAFYPGPGVGGHCIPLDPFYLEHIAKAYDFNTTLITTAGQVNTLMPHRMQVKIGYALNRAGKPMNQSSLLFIGVAYKPNIADCRESPALAVIDECLRKLANVHYHDPYVPQVTTREGHHLASQSLAPEDIRSADCVIITTNHSCIDYATVAREAKLVVDFRNATRGLNGNIVRL